MAETGTAPATAERKARPRLTSKVVRQGTANTTFVEIKYNMVDPKYRKTRTFSRRLAVHHDHNIEFKAGDTVEIAACRPMSKTKKHRLVRVVASGYAPVNVDEATA